MLHNSKLISETDENYHIQLPSGHKMSLDKKGLSEKAHGLIKSMKAQHLDEGGIALSSPDIDPNGVENNFGAQPQAPSISGHQSASTQPAPSAEMQPSQSFPMVGDKISNANAAFEAEKSATQGAADVMGAEGATEAKAIKAVTDKVSSMPSQQDIFNKYQTADDEYKKSLDSKAIDPDRYWHDKSTGSKIAAGIGMLLGGFGAVAGQPNLAATMIQNSIDRDIEAQKSDQFKSLNLWKMNREKLGTELGANLATQNQLYTGLKFKIEQAASQFKGPLAQQQAKAAIALIDQKKADNNFKLSLFNSSDGDPSAKVQFLVPPERQKDVFDEIKNAQDTKRIAPEILNAFDKAANNTHLVDFSPIGHSADQKNFMGLMNTTVKDIEGTAKKAAFDSIQENMMPQVGDNRNTLKTKRKLVEDYILSHSSAPQAKGFGIDLSKHQSTAPIQQTPEIKTMNGARYQKVPGGWSKI